MRRLCAYALILCCAVALCAFIFRRFVDDSIGLDHVLLPGQTVTYPIEGAWDMVVVRAHTKHDPAQTAHVGAECYDGSGAIKEGLSLRYKNSALRVELHRYQDDRIIATAHRGFWPP